MVVDFVKQFWGKGKWAEIAQPGIGCFDSVGAEDGRSEASPQQLQGKLYLVILSNDRQVRVPVTLTVEARYRYHMPVVFNYHP